MNHLAKSLFIGFYPTISLAGVGFSLWEFYHRGFNWPSLGLLLCALPILLVLSLFYLIPVARTYKSLPGYSSVILGGLAVSCYGAFQQGNFTLTLLLAVLLTLGWLAYLIWYSVFTHRGLNEQLLVGNTLPEFSLLSLEGNSISSISFRDKNHILMFFRGNWCPLCMAQVKELVGMYKDLEKRNIQITLISSQSMSKTQSLADKFDLDFQFLRDVDCEAAKKLGIFAKNGLPIGFQIFGYDRDTILPTVVLTDAKGIILHCDLTSNYRIRPVPSAFLEVFDQAKTSNI